MLKKKKIILSQLRRGGETLEPWGPQKEYFSGEKSK